MEKNEKNLHNLIKMLMKWLVLFAEQCTEEGFYVVISIFGIYDIEKKIFFDRKWKLWKKGFCGIYV